MTRLFGSTVAILAGLACLSPVNAAVHVGISGHGHGHQHHRHQHGSSSISFSWGNSCARPARVVTTCRPAPRVCTPTTTVVRRYVTTSTRHTRPIIATPTRVIVHDTCDGTPYKEYYSCGQLKITGYTENGLRTGEWVWYDRQGKRQQTGEYLAGQRHGTWVRYRSNGNIMYQADFNNGELIKEIRYGSSGACRWL